MGSRRKVLVFFVVSLAFLMVASIGQAAAPLASIRVRVVAVGDGELGGRFSLETTAQAFPGLNTGGSVYRRAPSFGSLFIRSENSCMSADTDNGFGVSAGAITSFRDQSGLDLDGKWLVVEAREEPLGLRVRALLPADGEAVCLAGGSFEFTAEVLRGSIVIEGS